MQVNPIKPADAYPWLLQKHYAKRLCPVEYAFGLFDGDALIGVVTYGTPASAPLRAGVCGPDHAGKVLELNRLVCDPRQEQRKHVDWAQPCNVASTRNSG